MEALARNCRFRRFERAARFVYVSSGSNPCTWGRADYSKRGAHVAKNTGNNSRRGSVDNRTQSQNPVNGNFTKRNTDTGRFMQQKENGKPFKGVAQEKDHRRG